MSSRGYKPGELFRRTMLARVTNPSRNDTECQEDSQGNSLAAGVEQVCDDVELTAESLDETDGPAGGVPSTHPNACGKPYLSSMPFTISFICCSVDGSFMYFGPKTLAMTSQVSTVLLVEIAPGITLHM